MTDEEQMRERFEKKVAQTGADPAFVAGAGYGYQAAISSLPRMTEWELRELLAEYIEKPVGYENAARAVIAKLPHIVLFTNNAKGIVMAIIKLQNRGFEEYHVPKPINFVRRVEDDCPVPLGELSDAQVRKLEAALTKAMLNRAAVQRKNGTEGGGPRRSFILREYGE